MHYKWKKVIFPDEKSKLIYYVPPIIEVISPETYKDFTECVRAGKEHSLDLPDSYGGPYLQVLSACNKETLDAVYKYHKIGDIHNMYKAYANVHTDEIDKMHLPAGASHTCRLQQNILDLKTKVLQHENFDPTKPNMEFNKWSLKPRYRPKWEEHGDLCWHQKLSDEIELAVDYSINRGHSKLYVYKGLKEISFSPSELYTLVQMYDSIMFKMYECTGWQSEVQLQENEWTDRMCSSGHGCTHDYPKPTRDRMK